MTTLKITRGLPGCGKTTFARNWVSLDREHRARVNRDDLRTMVDDGAWVKGVTEPRILAARDGAILALLRKGVDVINDDTNLPQRTVRDLAKLAKRAGAKFEVIDMTDVPLETCIERDSYRAKALGDEKNPVGEEVIRDMHRRFLRGRNYPLPLPEEPADTAELVPYEPVPGTTPAILVDIDGTVALMGARSPFDETRVHEDRPNYRVINVVEQLYTAGNNVVFLSGRTAKCKDATLSWLLQHVQVPFDGLFMRPEGDGRKDSIVKYELFNEHVRNQYNVTAVLDDRNQVVQMWRAIGLTVLQVADGDF